MPLNERGKCNKGSIMHLPVALECKASVTIFCQDGRKEWKKKSKHNHTKAIGIEKGTTINHH